VCCGCVPAARCLRVLSCIHCFLPSSVAATRCPYGLVQARAW
jgi:hypothetical protein